MSKIINPNNAINKLMLILILLYSSDPFSAPAGLVGFLVTGAIGYVLLRLSSFLVRTYSNCYVLLV